MVPEPRYPVAIYDIIHCIIAHLDPDPYVDDSHNPEGRSIRQALARLARTHSTFTKPALSELWRSLPGDDVLCHLLCVLGIANEVPQEDGWSGPRLVRLSNYTLHSAAITLGIGTLWDIPYTRVRVEEIRRVRLLSAENHCRPISR